MGLFVLKTAGSVIIAVRKPADRSTSKFIDSINPGALDTLTRPKGIAIYFMVHPCKMAFDSLWKEPCEISKEILTDAETKFDKWVNHYEAMNCYT
ncbi:MAG: hypothetical protein D4R64_00900 [Porphyromonadaceae bacterium]|nr:MAG: hypothetical protein D4R64_00900 [Porphyromonadaceae bacterium]